MTMPHLLVVDDEPDVAEFLAEVGRRCGYEVSKVCMLPEIQQALAEGPPQVVTLDLQIPNLDGVQLLRYLAEQKVKAGILLISGTDSRVRSTSLRLGKELGLNMLGTLQKPVHVAELETILQRAIPNAPPTPERLAQAIENNELVVHYQPQVLLKKPMGQVIGVEALVRWQHPDRGLVPPVEFLGVVESAGLMGALTRRVFLTAVADQQVWHRDGLDLMMAVNFSPELFTDLELPDIMSRHVAEGNGDISKIKVEITETGTMRDVARSMEILTRLRLKGFALSMDDFGTGSSSLVQLYRLPFNELKIDRSFVSDFEQNPEAETIVSITIDLARNLGLRVCAEGVETESAYRRLCDLGCHLAQGYFISKPIPAAAVPDWVRKWQAPLLAG